MSSQRENHQKIDLSSALMLKSYINWDIIQNEVDKCVIRCSNCHRIKTAKEKGYWKHKIQQNQS
jgi:hypothetical protein